MQKRNNVFQFPALLTGTVHPHTQAISRLNDPKQRLTQYETVLRWVAVSGGKFSQVVFCENSEADLSALHPLKTLFEKHGRHLDLVSTPRPRTNDFPGKGWAEGAMMEWALHNVSCLRDAESFLKITGRYIVRNLAPLSGAIHRIVKIDPRIRFLCQFPSAREGPYIETSLFWSSRAFYLDELADAYHGVADYDGVFFEHVIGRRLFAACDTVRIGVFPFRPIFSGRRGFDGKRVMTRGSQVRAFIRQLFSSCEPVRYLSRRDAI